MYQLCQMNLLILHFLLTLLNQMIRLYLRTLPNLSNLHCQRNLLNQMIQTTLHFLLNLLFPHFLLNLHYLQILQILLNLYYH